MKDVANNTDPDEAEDNQRNQLPVDRGWAWVILAASWVNMFIVNGSFRTFGIIFPEIQERFGASASTTSLISALNLIAFGLTTIIVQTLGLRYFSTRQTVMAGSFILCISYVISAFSPVVKLLMLFQGVIPGLASALIFAPTSSLTGEYFDKRRGFALCVSTTGGCLGLFAFSFLMRISLDSYGFSGTMLLMGAVLLHGMVTGALQRPMFFYSARGNVCVEKLDKQTDLGTVANGDTLVTRKDDKTISPLLKHHMTPSLTRVSKRVRTYSQNSQGSLVLKPSFDVSNVDYWRYASNEFTSSMLDINANTGDAYHTETMTKEQSGTQTSNTKLRISFEALKVPAYLVCLPSGCLLAIGSSLTLVFLPSHAKDVGLSDTQASILVSMVSITDMVSIPLWGLFADRRWLKSRNIAAISVIIMGVTLYFMPLFTTFKLLMFFCLIYGLLGRVWFSMYTLVLVDMLGLDSFKSALGIQLLCQTITNAIFTYIVGVMRDALGSYIPSFQLMATLMIVGATGILSIPLVERCDRGSNGIKNQKVLEVEPESAPCPA